MEEPGVSKLVAVNLRTTRKANPPSAGGPAEGAAGETAARTA
jgi:hypothetical protein